MARSFHEIVLLGKLRQAVCRATDREGGGCLLLDNQYTKTGQPVAEVLWKNHLDMRVTSVENPTCTSFEEYEDISKMVPLDFTEDDVMWVASKLSGAAGALGAEVMELRNWLLRFGCASVEFIVVVFSLVDWMAKSSPPWALTGGSLAWCLVALDKRPRVRPVGIGETLRRYLAKLLMRAAGEQAKTAYGNLQLCAGLKASIEGATHAVVQRILERVRERRGEKEEADNSAEEEGERGGLDGLLNNLIIETAGTEEEVTEGLAAALKI